QPRTLKNSRRLNRFIVDSFFRFSRFSRFWAFKRLQNTLGGTLTSRAREISRPLTDEDVKLRIQHAKIYGSKLQKRFFKFTGHFLRVGGDSLRLLRTGGQ